MFFFLCWFHIFFYFHPENWGNYFHFDEHIVQMGWFNHQPVFFVAFLQQNHWENSVVFSCRFFAAGPTSAPLVPWVRKFHTGYRGLEVTFNLWKHGGTSQLGGFCISFSIKIYTYIYMYTIYTRYLQVENSFLLKETFFFLPEKSSNLHPFFGSATKNRRWGPSRRRIWHRGCWSASLRFRHRGRKVLKLKLWYMVYVKLVFFGE